jgi:hypothetical protein
LSEAALAAPGLEAGAARPWGGRAFTLLAWGLAFHIVAMAVLFGLLRLPMALVRALAAWKEVLALLLLAAVTLRAVAGRGGHVAIRPPDVLVAALFALTALHVLAAQTGWGPVDDPTGLAYGARDLVFFFGLYFVGRGASGAATSERALRTLFVVGVITSLVAVLEWAFVTPQLLVVLGVASYFNDFLGASAFTAGNVYGLPDNYWTMIGGRLVKRAGSVQLSSQGFAVPFLVIIPAATAWLYLQDRWRRWWAVLGYAIIWAGLLLTITRMTLVACSVQVLLMIVLRRRPAPLVALGVAGTAVAVVLLASVPGIAGYVWETLLWQTASSGSHARDYARGLAALATHPFGSGIGTTDATAVRLGLEPIMGDNLVLKYAVELGVLGGTLLVAFFACVLWSGVRRALLATDERDRMIGALGAALAVGAMLNGITAVIFYSPMLAYLLCWLVGASITGRAPESPRPSSAGGAA